MPGASGSRDQGRLYRVIQVGFAWPDGVDDLIAGIELVVPGPVFQIEEVAFGVRPPGCGQIGVTIITGPRCSAAAADMPSATTQCIRSRITGLPSQSVV